ncbi:MAG: hypothetical protein K0U24_06170 [Gammaproteobacteria bacterium]|nr:hypothetical protein [Gammaproteobacteria bacterium]MCH9715784.1 hypothetical protein [Gammaproteobacteria bacterium]MCH9763790.1 hypothetical protein [Gammaproteobacteria bacterium]
MPTYEESRQLIGITSEISHKVFTPIRAKARRLGFKQNEQSKQSAERLTEISNESNKILEQIESGTISLQQGTTNLAALIDPDAEANIRALNKSNPSIIRTFASKASSLVSSSDSLRVLQGSSKRLKGIMSKNPVPLTKESMQVVREASQSVNSEPVQGDIELKNTGAKGP